MLVCTLRTAIVQIWLPVSPLFLHGGDLPANFHLFGFSDVSESVDALLDHAEYEQAMVMTGQHRTFVSTHRTTSTRYRGTSAARVSSPIQMRLP